MCSSDLVYLSLAYGGQRVRYALPGGAGVYRCHISWVGEVGLVQGISDAGSSTPIPSTGLRAGSNLPPSRGKGLRGSLFALVYLGFGFEGGDSEPERVGVDHRCQLLSGQGALDGLTLDTPNAAGLAVHNLVAFVFEGVLGSIQGVLKEPGRPNLVRIGDIT